MTNGGYISIILLIIGLFIFRECEHRSEMKEMRETIESVQDYMNDEMKSYFAGMDIKVQDVKIQNQKIVNDISQIKDIQETNPELKDIRSVIKAELESKISGIIAYTPPAINPVLLDTSGMIHIDTVNKYYVQKGSKAIKNDLWYDLSVTLSDSLEVDSLKVREKIDAILAWKKPDKSFKFLRKSEPVVKINSYNPYTTIGNINNLVVEDKKSKFVKVLSSKPMMFVYGIIGTATFLSLK